MWPDPSPKASELSRLLRTFVFFFQAEDGIRDYKVTGVQTCALPIFRAGIKFHDGSPVTPEDVKWSYEHYHGASATLLQEKTHAIDIVNDRTVKFSFKIGRASCRERV